MARRRNRLRKQTLKLAAPPVRSYRKQRSSKHGSKCRPCNRDQRFLRSKRRPPEKSNGRTITAADIFAGCGGMTLGLREGTRRAGATLKIALAIDVDPEVAAIYERNLDPNIKVA